MQLNVPANRRQMRIEEPLRRNARRHSQLPKIPVIEAKIPVPGLKNRCFEGQPFLSVWRQNHGFPCTMDVSDSRSWPIFPVNIPVNGIYRRKVRTRLGPQPTSPELFLSPASSAEFSRHRGRDRDRHSFFAAREAITSLSYRPALGGTRSRRSKAPSSPNFSL